ncbi:MAG: uracil-DNA glycosylase [Bacteroidota bacterium]
MNTRLQQQYLDAMGITRWVPRGGSLHGLTEESVINAAQTHAPGAAVEPPPVPVSMERDGVSANWTELETAVRSCTKCPLHATRTQTVFGVGSRHARWMFIGEAPGADEDRQGEPFVGRAGQLLNAMLFAMGLKREEVYIANVLKCRPPGNRDPQPEEVAQCEPYLLRQIELIRPALIIALGRHAAHSLLKTEAPLARLRGQRLSYHGTPLIVTYHPAYLLRNPADKRKAWDDLCLAKTVMQKSGGDDAAAALRTKTS